MSMYLEFEPHSWYYEFAIKKDDEFNDPCGFVNPDEKKYCIIHGNIAGRYDNWCEGFAPKWSAFTDDGNSYSIVELHGTTLSGLKSEIRKYWLRDNGKHIPAFYREKLLKSKESSSLKEAK